MSYRVYLRKREKEVTWVFLILFLQDIPEWLKSFNLQDLTSIFQIAFFITGGTVAILTYKSAKRSLLNTVNTEYQKRVMDKLEHLSKKLYDEFNPESDNYWMKTSERQRQYFDEIVDGYKNRNSDEENAYNLPGVRSSIYDIEIEILLNDVKTDPFIPEEIIDKLVDGLDTKQVSRKLIFYEGIQDFKKELSEGKFDQDIDEASFAIQNYLNDKMYEAGCGTSQIEDEIHEVRKAIRRYLNTFDPFYKKTK